MLLQAIPVWSFCKPKRKNISTICLQSFSKKAVNSGGLKLLWKLGPWLHKIECRKKFLPSANKLRNRLKVLINRRPLHLMVVRTCKKFPIFCTTTEVITMVRRIRWWYLSWDKWIQSIKSQSTSLIFVCVILIHMFS